MPKKLKKVHINEFIDAHDQIVRNLKMLESLLKYTNSEFEFLYGIENVIGEYLKNFDKLVETYFKRDI